MSAVGRETGGTAGRHHLRPAAAVAAAAALLVGLPLLLGVPGRLAATLLLQLAVVVGCAALPAVAQPTGPARWDLGTLAVAGAAGVAADLALALPRRPPLTGLLAVLALAFLLLILRQMLRRPRPAVVASLAGGVLLTGGIGALALLALAGRSGGPVLPAAAVVVVAAAVLAGHLADLALPRPRLAEPVPRGPAGLAAAAVVGGLIGALAHAGLRGGGDTPSAGAGLLYGLALGLTAGLAGLVASYLAIAAEDPPRARSAAAPGAWAAPAVQAVLPFAAAAPVALALQAVL